jgi:hypothetical protein
MGHFLPSDSPFTLPPGGKFKRSSFVMSTFPGVIGGKLEGEIQTGADMFPAADSI